MKITKNGLKIPENSDVADLTVFVGENMEIVDDLAGKMAPYDDSGIKEEIGDITDLATNTKTNLVGAINELADFDEFTVTDDTYEFTTSKRNVIMHCTATEPGNRSFFLKGTEQGQIITIYNPYWDGGTSDLWVDCYTPGSGGQESVNIRIGDNHTFQYANGNLWDLEACGARLIDYGVGSDYVKMEKPAKRYFVQVPVGNASTSTLQISNLDIGRDKKYYIHACVCSDVTNTIRLEAFDGMMSVWGSVTTDGVMTDVFDAGNFGSFSTAYNDIVLLITGVLEPDYMMGYVKCELDITYGDLSLNEIHHRKISSLVDGTVFVRLVINKENCYFLEKSFLEITTV